MKLPLAVAALLLQGCGPDPLLGDFFARVDERNTLGERSSRSQWMSVLVGRSDDYEIRIFGLEVDSCVYTANREGPLARVTPRHPCTPSNRGTGVVEGTLFSDREQDAVVLDLHTVLGEVGYRSIYTGTRR